MFSDGQPGSSFMRKGLMVDTRATSHIITDLAKFRSFYDQFQAETHCVDLANVFDQQQGATLQHQGENVLQHKRGERFLIHALLFTYCECEQWLC